MKEILDILPERISGMLSAVSPAKQAGIREIRLRREKTILLKTPDGEYGLNKTGLSRYDGEKFTRDDCERFWRRLTAHSPYALAVCGRQGYITIPGGHRIGLCGEAVIKENDIHLFKNVSSFLIRIAHQVRGCALPLIDRITYNSRPLSSLIISPPGCGKTTMLRDLARIFSEMGFNVCIADERGEISSGRDGIACLDIGPRTDFICGADKADGMNILLRSMSPDLIITDELGSAGEARAVLDAAAAGVSVIASAHGGSLDGILARPSLSGLFEAGVFSRYIILSDIPGRIKEIYDAEGRPLETPGAGRMVI